MTAYCEVSRFWHSTVTGGDGAVRYNLWAGFHLANCREIQKIWSYARNTSVGLWHCENGVPSVPVVPAGSLRHQSHRTVQQRDAVLRVRINFTAQLICTNYNARRELHSITRRFSISARRWGKPILIEVKMFLEAAWNGRNLNHQTISLIQCFQNHTKKERYNAGGPTIHFHCPLYG